MIRFGMHCHLLLPDLFWPERERREIYGELELPALELLLAKGRQRGGEGGTLESWLCGQFGVEKNADWPIAPYSLLADGGEPGAQHWLRADPVHLKLEGNRLVLADSGMFAIAQQEAESLAESLNAHFAAEGLSFHPLRPSRWYLRCEAAPALETTELPQAAGRSIDKLLPRGVDSVRWRARMNEWQMLLHEHAVNVEREQAGQLAVNSVWIWGGGALQGAPSAPYHAVWAANSVAIGLARAAHLAANELPDDALALLRASAEEGVALIVLDRLRAAAQYGDTHTWREGLKELERRWFAPLVQALKQSRIGMLTLHALGSEDEFCVEVTRGDLRRFWRRARPLEDLAPS